MPSLVDKQMLNRSLKAVIASRRLILGIGPYRAALLWSANPALDTIRDCEARTCCRSRSV